MANVQPDRREPLEFTAGTSINFQRNFRLYPAPDWVIVYEIRGAAVPIEFVSAQPANGGTEQLVFVPGTTTEGWPPGTYEMSGYATNATTGEKYECYHPSEITINPDLQTAPGDQSTKTFSQLMVERLEAVMLGRASNDILDSEINGTMIRRIPIRDLKEFYYSFRHQRQGEIAKERARNKQPTGRRITTQIAVTFPNPVLGGEGFGPGNIYRGGL